MTAPSPSNHGTPTMPAHGTGNPGRSRVVAAASIDGPDSSTAHPPMQRDSGLPQVVTADYPEVAEICYPQVIDTCPPEALSGDPPEVYWEKADRRRKGMRNSLSTKFCLLLTVLVCLVVVVAAVVGGVLGSRSGKHESRTSNTISTPGPTPQPSTSPQLLPSTSLVSFNYTDNGGIEHHRVLYQKTDGIIYQSAWNSSKKSWAMTAVSAPEMQQDSHVNLDVRLGTPLAGGVCLLSNEVDISTLSISMFHLTFKTRNFHFFYLDKTSSAIRELYAQNDADGLWGPGPSDGRYIADTTSRLAWYGRTCLDYCRNYDVLFYQSTERRVQYLLSGPEIALDEKENYQVDTGSTLPVSGTSFGIVPVRSSNESEQGLDVFINAGNLVEMQGVSPFTVLSPFSSDIINSNASITSFAWGDISVGSGTGNKQVLFTNPDSDSNGGVSMWSFDGAWTKRNSVAELSDIMSNSPLTANSAGLLYGLTNGTDGLELVEWIWNPEGLVFKKLGVVRTD